MIESNRRLTLAVINTSFLIVSCVGGDTGRIGREWYTRLVVIETITYPLVGPVRRKKFYQDTQRLLYKWGCVKTKPVDATSASVRMHMLNSSSSQRKSCVEQSNSIKQTPSQRKVVI